MAPFVGLGRRLADAGCAVAVAAHAGFEAPVRAAGLEFRALPVDPRAQLASAGGQRLVRSGNGLRGSAELLRMARRFVPELARGVLDAAQQGADVMLLSATTTPIGQVVAEALELPSAGLFLQPLEPTRAFPPVVWGGTRGFGPVGNRLAGQAALLAVDRLFGPATRRLRRELGLPRASAGKLRRRHMREGWPVFYGFSPSVVPRPADWVRTSEVVGYWWPHTAEDWRPPGALADFLAAGPPPVHLGFGSLVVPDPERLAATVAEAVRTARVRAVVQSGWSGLRVAGDDVLTVDEVPHSWLFPRTAAVVHHAGAGTTAAGLRAGVPAVPVPAQLDAAFWAARLTALGVSPGPVPLRGLTAPRLAAAIRRAVEDPAPRRRARLLADRVAADDGAAAVLRFVERVG